METDVGQICLEEHQHAPPVRQPNTFFSFYFSTRSNRAHLPIVRIIKQPRQKLLDNKSLQENDSNNKKRQKSCYKRHKFSDMHLFNDA